MKLWCQGSLSRVGRGFQPYGSYRPLKPGSHWSVRCSISPTVSQRRCSDITAQTSPQKTKLNLSTWNVRTTMTAKYTKLLSWIQSCHGDKSLSLPYRKPALQEQALSRKNTTPSALVKPRKNPVSMVLPLLRWIIFSLLHRLGMLSMIAYLFWNWTHNKEE